MKKLQKTSKKKSKTEKKEIAQMRVYQFSKQLNLSSNAVIALLKEMKFSIKSPMSNLTDKMIEAVKKKLDDDSKKLKVEEIERKKRVKSEKEGTSQREKVTESTWKEKKQKRKHELKKKKEEIKQKVRETVKRMGGISKPKKIKRTIETVTAEEEAEKDVIKISEFMSVSELANILEVDPTNIIKKCLGLGLLVTINQRMDLDTITMIADEYNVDVELLPEYTNQVMEKEDEKDDKAKTEPRPSIVTVMGHVDHGKTLLLDKIRNSNVIAQEKGGITQHIGAYSVPYKKHLITFLDTPGHKAFTAMRARGAQITDIVILVVAADDGVMPQTIEAIDHARAANIPIIVAINKIDLDSANPEYVKQQLSKNKVLLEEYGGNTLSVQVSAKTEKGIKELLDAIILQSEIMELKARKEGHAKGVVIEARMDKGKGAVATVLVQKGTVHIGDPFVTGLYSGKVRAMTDEFDTKVSEAEPSKPVQIMGINGLPEVGDTFVIFENEQKAREVARKRQFAKREQIEKGKLRYSLVQFQEGLKEGEAKELKIVLKGDVGGSVEALADALGELSTDEAKILIIHKGVGAINDSDVLLSAASNAVIVGFHVKANPKVNEMIKREGVEIRLYNIIFEAISDIKMALSGLLEPEYHEEILGLAEVKQVFKIPSIGFIAGSFVVKGKIVSGEEARIKRNDEIIHEAKVTSLKRFKEDVKEVEMGLECGIGFSGVKDVKENDIIESYRVIETKREL